ncbi:MAG: dephospho-CoA kinase [Desulfobacterales bacterium]|nr:dephospho-CoA kinase [Desulfobacterales bacterium]
MIIAGLTGGIATGKSTVSSIFKELGAFIIDADKISHEVVKYGKPAWEDIVKHFGNDVLLSNGEINRIYLGNIIFNNHNEKQVLNNIVHPHVFQEMLKQLEEIKNSKPESIAILDVPLLIECGMHKGIPDVILVYVNEEIQLERLIKRDGISKEEALSRIKSQMPIEEKKMIANIIIDNSLHIENTKKQIFDIYNSKW